MGLEASDIGRIFDICLHECEKDLITAQMIYYKDVSDFMVYSERFASEDKKDPLTAYQMLVFEQSEIHKQYVIEKMYGSPQQVEYKTRESGFRMLLEGMGKGTDVLCDLPAFYMPERLAGAFDILEKRDTESSKFGDYHYVVKEVITAKTIDDHHEHRGAFYNYLLGKIQQYTPPHFYLINRDHQETEIDYSNVEEDLKKMLKEINEIFEGKKVTTTYNACAWPWETYNNDKAVEMNDVSLVCGINTKIKGKLVAKKIRTLGDLVATTPADLAKIRGIGLKNAQKFHRKAKALADNDYSCIKPCKFQKEVTEIFLDFEGITEQLYCNVVVDIDYLMGAVVRTGGKAEYIPFVAHYLDEEGKMFDQFMKWLLQYKSYVIYHWSHHEMTHLEKLAGRYGFPKKTLSAIKSNMVDLSVAATSSFVFPTYKDNLKHIATYTGFSWKHADVDAKECIALYFQYVENPRGEKRALRKILDYNEDDCRALMHIKDWMQRNSCQEVKRLADTENWKEQE